MRVTALLSCALISTGQTIREPHSFFKEQIGLNEEQIAEITTGKAFAKVLPSKTPSEIIVFGAVFVNARPEDYVKLAFDMDRLRHLPSYLGVGRFSDPPVLSDLAGFKLEPDDIKNLKNCRPGKCGMQLPAREMKELQGALDRSGHDDPTRVNEMFRKMALEMVQQYQKEGNRVLGSYRDKDRPFDVNAELQSLLNRPEAQTVYLPELNRYLLDYPNATLPNSESIFYWERVSFGLKPTLRLNHAVAYRSTGPRGVAYVVAVKQLYASHYFQLALDLTACVPASAEAGAKGFYLISLRGSRQHGLTGFTGSIVRLIVVARTRYAQEKVLINIKKALEDRK